VKTNSSFTQNINITGGDYEKSFSGVGERNEVIGQDTIAEPPKNLKATFTFSGPDGVIKTSKLNKGGPYIIKSYNVLIIVAENGDDSDYNDSILEFSWYTPK